MYVSPLIISNYAQCVLPLFCLFYSLCVKNWFVFNDAKSIIACIQWDKSHVWKGQTQFILAQKLLVSIHTQRDRKAVDLALYFVLTK